MIVECGVEWSKILFMLFEYLVIVWGESNGRTILGLSLLCQHNFGNNRHMSINFRIISTIFGIMW